MKVESSLYLPSIYKPIEYTIHPSKRNSFLYNKNRENVLIKLRKIIK